MRHIITALVVAITCAAQAAPRTPDPEMDALRAELRELKREARQAEKRRQKLAQLRQQIEELKK